MGTKFLGFSFTNAGMPKRRIAPKADRFKGRVRELTSRNKGVSTERMAEQLSRYLRGWLGYFGKCQTPSVLEGLDRWIRRRLRSAIWRQWRLGSTKFARLRQRGVGKDLAAQTGGQRSRPLADRRLTRAPHRAAQCLLRFARDSQIDCPSIAQPAEPPDADPHVRCVGGEKPRGFPLSRFTSPKRTAAVSAAQRRPKPAAHSEKTDRPARSGLPGLRH